jgi:HD-like signal output (HDOD) protein
MFAWLWERLTGKGPQNRAPGRAGSGRADRSGVQPTPHGAQRSLPSHKPRPSKAASDKETYLDTLTREAGVLEPLSPSEEQQTIELVQEIVGHLSTHVIEPPVVPALAARMLELLRAPEIDVQALARLIERDQATAAKLMSIANSALYRGQTEIETVRDAVVFLGTDEVARIAIGLASRALFEGPASQRDGHNRWARLFNHAMTTAFAASHMATARNRRHSEGAFLGGLFHDVGKAMALRALIDLDARKQREPAPEVIVAAALHMIHSEPTCVLYERWKLPRQLMTICQSHHRIHADYPLELHFVRLVSGIDTLRTGTAFEKREALSEIEESAAALKLTDPQLRVANTETQEFSDRMATMYS